MPRKRTRSERKSSSSLDPKGKQIKQKEVQVLVKRLRLKRQPATDEGAKKAQRGSASDSDKVSDVKEVLDIKDASAETSLLQFKFERILSENPTSKSVVVYGKFPDKSDENFAVILAEKTAFSHEAVKNLFTENTSFMRNFQNDIYGQYSSDAGIKLTVIYPATEKHVKKYSQQQSYMVQESAAAYVTKIKSYAETQALSLQWVDNILDGHAEADRVIYNDEDPETGFLLLPDLKWSQENVEDLYVLAIVRKKGILCLRELDASHLPLLENVCEQARKAIEVKYKVPANQIRAYIHYHPTYYHLHIHFTMIGYHAPGSMVGQSHLLEDVIDNLKHVDSHYYRDKTMTYQVREDSPLLPLLKT